MATSETLMIESDPTGPAAEAAELLIKARAGDVNAFEDIMKLHERQVYRTALRILGQQQDAQDAAQEVFLRLYKYLNRVDASRKLSPWLYRVTINVCHDIRRKRPAGSEPLEDIAELAADPPKDAPELEQQRKMMALGLKTLSEKERSAVVLRDVEGLSTGEVAEILGSSETTVRSHICRARLKLKTFRDRFLRRKS